MPTSAIPGVVFSARTTWPDHRGSFLELFRASEYSDEFVQINHSFSRCGVLRGLHYHQRQADLWYVVRGLAQVALADIRGTRPVVEIFELSGDSAATLYIPPGVAHGYLAVEDLDLIYAVTQTYNPGDEHGLAWDDATLAIPWRFTDPILSARDAGNTALKWTQASAS